MSKLKETLALFEKHFNQNDDDLGHSIEVDEFPAELRRHFSVIGVKPEYLDDKTLKFSSDKEAEKVLSYLKSKSPSAISNLVDNMVLNGDKIVIKESKNKDVPSKHQLKIAIDTVKNPNKSMLGGPSEQEAIKILKDKFKYSDEDIKKLQESKKNEYRIKERRTLTASQKKILDKQPMDILSYDDLPGDVWDELERINDTEILWSEVNRYLHDRSSKHRNKMPWESKEMEYTDATGYDKLTDTQNITGKRVKVKSSNAFGSTGVILTYNDESDTVVVRLAGNKLVTVGIKDVEILNPNEDPKKVDKDKEYTKNVGVKIAKDQEATRKKDESESEDEYKGIKLGDEIELEVGPSKKETFKIIYIDNSELTIQDKDGNHKTVSKKYLDKYL
jgi:hypothetical protein